MSVFLPQNTQCFPPSNCPFLKLFIASARKGSSTPRAARHLVRPTLSYEEDDEEALETPGLRIGPEFIFSASQLCRSAQSLSLSGPQWDNIHRLRACGGDPRLYTWKVPGGMPGT